MLKALLLRWTWRMAWRESRSSRARLLWFSLSISLGVAALAAVGSLSATIHDAIEAQAKGLLGADLVFSSRQPFSPEAEDFASGLGAAAQARETGFSTMLVFPNLTNATRLVSARALSGEFPFYGRIETNPESAVDAMRRGDGLIVEESVLYQFGANVGDPVKIGSWDTRIAGTLKRMPGDSVSFSTIAPRVLFSATKLESTHLLGAASLARYRIMFRFDDNRDMSAWLEGPGTNLAALHVDTDTVEKRKRDLGDGIANLNRFLGMVALIALILGSVGIASALQVHIGSKLPNAAVLRCLGAGTAPTSAIYLAQGLALAAVGTAAGLLLGLSIHSAVPALIQGFVPVPLESGFHWGPALVAALAGFAISAAFTLLPLGAMRGVSPLKVIRADFESRAADAKRWSLWIMVAIFAGLTLFAGSQARRWSEGFTYIGSLAAAFGVLALVARLLVLAAKKFTPRNLPFAWRQGLASLHRPGNRTVLVLTAVGLGTFLLVTLQLTRDVLLTQLFPPGRASQPNAILFDIQPDQRDGVLEVLKNEGLPLLDEAPIITMRVASVKGRTTDEILADKTTKIPGWTLRREYRSTWRTNLVSSEKLEAGELVPRVENLDAPIPITVETGIARELGVSVGDEMVFDIQGVLLTNRVAGLRTVDWRQVRPNFFVVFPAGALEAAPAMHVMATRVETAADSARMQRTLVARFPNVSAIDLTLVLQTLDGVVTKAGFAIRFMALFTVLTGLLVMAGAILTGRWQRIREVVLLRTLGANRRQLRQGLMAEYAALGVMGAATGVLMAVVAAWALARFTFRAGFTVAPLTLVVAFAIVTALTVIVGMLSSRGITEEPPLAILRREG
jgi:putative ABC transport system permease protein